MIRCRHCGREMEFSIDFGDKSGWTITEKEFSKSGEAYFSWCDIGKGPHVRMSESEIVVEILSQYKA